MKPIFEQLMVTEEYFWSDELQQYCVVCWSDKAASASADNSRDADDERLLASFNSRPSAGN